MFHICRLCPSDDRWRSPEKLWIISQRTSVDHTKLEVIFGESQTSSLASICLTLSIDPKRNDLVPGNAVTITPFLCSCRRIKGVQRLAVICKLNIRIMIDKRIWTIMGSWPRVRAYISRYQEQYLNGSYTEFALYGTEWPVYFTLGTWSLTTWVTSDLTCTLCM